MTLDATTDTLHADGYHMTAAVEVTPVGLSCRVVTDHDFEIGDDKPGRPRRAENVMVWVNGRLIGQLYDHGKLTGVSYTYGGYRSTSQMTVPRSALPVAGGPVTVLLGVWPQSAAKAAIARFTFAVDTPPQPLAAMDGIIVRSAFHSTTTCFGPDTFAILADAGINTLTFGGFNNPADQPAWDTYEKWRLAWEAIVGTPATAARTAGFHLLLTGDDLFRSHAERQWLDTSPFAEQAVTYVATRLAEIGVLGLDVQDEISGDPLDPLVVKFVGWWRAANGSRLGWPMIGLAVPPLPFEDAYGDYRSRFGDKLEWRDYAEDGRSVWQWWNAVKRMAVLSAGKPTLHLMSICGPNYLKRAPTESGDYLPGVDELYHAGVQPGEVVAAPWLSLAAGACGVRAYALDTFWYDSRRQPPGGGPQTGSRPGDVRWPALRATFRAVAAREALLLGPPAPYVEVGDWVFGFRDGLTWAVNVGADAAVPPLAGAFGVVLTSTGEEGYAGGLVPTGGVVLTGGL